MLALLWFRVTSKIWEFRFRGERFIGIKHYLGDLTQYQVRMGCGTYVDGHHSLILWRFEIHGGIDGHSLVIVYLQCTTNNRALSVFTYFWRATWEYGIPSRVRLDKGSENVMVCHFTQGEEATLLVHVLITNTLNDYGAMYIAVLLQHIMSCSTIWKKSRRCWSCRRPRRPPTPPCQVQELLDPESELDLSVLHCIFLPQNKCGLQRCLETAV